MEGTYKGAWQQISVFMLRYATFPNRDAQNG